MNWQALWEKLDAIPYGTAEVWKEAGVWTTASVTRSVRLGGGKPTRNDIEVVRTVLDEDVKGRIQEELDAVTSGMLTIDKHEGKIVSYKVVERLKVEEQSTSRRRKPAVASESK